MLDKTPYNTDFLRNVNLGNSLCFYAYIMKISHHPPFILKSYIGDSFGKQEVTAAQYKSQMLRLSCLEMSA
jgi:hypothetical protein